MAYLVLANYDNSASDIAIKSILSFISGGIASCVSCVSSLVWEERGGRLFYGDQLGRVALVYTGKVQTHPMKHVY